MTYRSILRSVALAGILAVHASFSNPTGNVTIVVTGLKNSKGAVLVSLFNNGQDFPRKAEKAVGKRKVTIQGGTATVTFGDLPFGRYAAAILHDENNNLKMDFNVVGMPKEGYGFSNNASGRLGPPSFEKAAFRLDAAGIRTEIKASYFPISSN